jgi:hypothetical protein
MSIRVLLTTAALAATALPASAQLVYSNDFDAPAFVGGGATATWTGPGGLQGTDPAFAATYGRIWRTTDDVNATTLTLTNLPAHTAVDIDFTAIFLDSWDSLNGSPAPDFYEVYIDGNLKRRYTANNASGTSTSVGGATLVAQYVQFDVNYFYSDTVADFTPDAAYSFSHTGSTLTFAIKAGGSGWQGGNDEALGIDNIRITLTPVPEPATLALLAGGLGLIGAAVRRRVR